MEYSPGFPNLTGGIVNGITGRPDDERSIAFRPAASAEGPDSWRWAEGRIAYSAWFLLAVSAS